MKAIHPTSDRIAVLPVLEEEKIAGLEIVREHRNIEMQHGVVVAAGPEVSGKDKGILLRLWQWLFGRMTQCVPEGQHVLFNPAAGTLLRRLKDDGTWEELRIMHADTIQCLVDA